MRDFKRLDCIKTTQRNNNKIIDWFKNNLEYFDFLPPFINEGYIDIESNIDNRVYNTDLDKYEIVPNIYYYFKFKDNVFVIEKWLLKENKELVCDKNLEFPLNLIWEKMNEKIIDFMLKVAIAFQNAYANYYKFKSMNEIVDFLDLEIYNTINEGTLEERKENFITLEQNNNQIFPFLLVSSYICYTLQCNMKQIRYKEKRPLTKHEQKQLDRNSKHTYNNVTNIIVKDYRYKYIINDDIEKSLNKNIKHYQRHIDTWGVRGHYRRYKNGKIIFIKAYTKGNTKSKNKKIKNYIVK